MRGDPFWMKAKFSSQCAKCKKPIEKGTEIFFYPKGKKAYCAVCGKTAEQDFRDCCEMEG